MAFSASGLFCQTFIDALDPTGLALDLDAETHKIALFQNAITTPDYGATAPVPAYGVAPFDANEASGTGYTAGGVVVTTTSLTVVSGSIVWDGADVSWAGSTITARGALAYADALAGNSAICGIAFGQDYSTNNGLFLITWDASGIFSIDCTP